MEDLRYKLTLIVVLGTLALLGPVLSSSSMAEMSWLGIPRSYYYILGVWILFISVSGWIVQKSKW